MLKSTYCVNFWLYTWHSHQDKNNSVFYTLVWYFCSMFAEILSSMHIKQFTCKKKLKCCTYGIPHRDNGGGHIELQLKLTNTNVTKRTQYRNLIFVKLFFSSMVYSTKKFNYFQCIFHMEKYAYKKCTTIIVPAWYGLNITINHYAYIIKKRFLNNNFAL